MNKSELIDDFSQYMNNKGYNEDCNYFIKIAIYPVIQFYDGILSKYYFKFKIAFRVVIVIF